MRSSWIDRSGQLSAHALDAFVHVELKTKHTGCKWRHKVTIEAICVTEEQASLREKGFLDGSSGRRFPQEEN